MLVKIIKKFSVFCIVMGLITAAHATGQGGYFGLMVGQSNLHGQNQSVTISPGVVETVKPQGSGVGSSLLAGYNMNEYAAIEGGFIYYSSMSYKTNTFSNNVKTRAGSFDILGKGMLPIWDSGFDIFGKLGGAYFFTKTSGKVQSVSIGTSTSSVFRPMAAIGVSYDMTQNWVADLSYTRLFYSNSQIKYPDFLALGISYHLLDAKCGQFLC
ncbi:MAG TPA: outer membrane beta-barrel protein [Gammaproteobacteria bacterium]|nr:outer membrane beta-barrel protein [Gammaproteobacteria bacterium]